MEQNSQKSKDSHEEKMRRVKSNLASLQPGEYRNITPFAKEINMSKGTAESLLDEALTWKEFFMENKELELIKDKNGEWVTIGRKK